MWALYRRFYTPALLYEAGFLYGLHIGHDGPEKIPRSTILLNRRTELLQKCRHKRKFTYAGFKTRKWDYECPGNPTRTEEDIQWKLKFKKIPWNKIPGTESSRTEFQEWKIPGMENSRTVNSRKNIFVVKLFWENSRTIFFQDRIFQDFLIPGKENSLKEFSRIPEQFQEWKFSKENAWNYCPFDYGIDFLPEHKGV